MPTTFTWGLTPQDIQNGEQVAAHVLSELAVRTAGMTAAQRSRMLEAILNQVIGVHANAQVVQAYVVNMRNQRMAPQQALVKAMGSQIAHKVRTSGPGNSLSDIVKPGATAQPSWVNQLASGVTSLFSTAMDTYTTREEQKSAATQADWDRRQREADAARQHELDLRRLAFEERNQPVEQTASSSGPIVSSGGEPVQDNTLLYVGLGIGAVVLLGGIGFLATRK